MSPQPPTGKIARSTESKHIVYLTHERAHKPRAQRVRRASGFNTLASAHSFAFRTRRARITQTMTAKDDTVASKAEELRSSRRPREDHSTPGPAQDH